MDNKTKNFKFGWHFSNKDNTLTHSDGRKIVPGVPLEARGLTATGHPACCRSGMHASEHILQAHGYSCGIESNLSFVLVSGEVTDRTSYGNKQQDKFAGRYRTALKTWKWKYIVGELFTKEYKKLHGCNPPRDIYRTSLKHEDVWLAIEERLKKEILG